MRSLFIAVVASLLSAQADAATQVFEKADALYRPLKFIFGTSLSFGHTSLYVASDSTYRFTADQVASGILPDIVNSDGLHSVIEAPGYGKGGVEIVSFADFLGPRPFWGAYEPAGGLSPAARYQAIIAAGKQLAKPYTMWSHWRGPDKFRCDGLVSFAYATVGVMLPENGGVTWVSNLPRTQRSQLSLRTAARAPGCQPTTRTASGSGFALATSNVKDDPFDGSGIDRVEYWNGPPASGGTLLGKDDHDSNPDAGLPASNGYSIISAVDPGANLFTRIYDQAGNFATCDVLGQVTGTNDLAQISPNIVEDGTPPAIRAIKILQDPVSQTATVSWTGSDDLTPASQINYAYAIDVPFDQWDDPNVTIVGQVNATSVDISKLTGMQHTFYLIAIDQEGNIGTAQQTFTPGPALSLSGNREPYHDFVGSNAPQKTPTLIALPTQDITQNGIRDPTPAVAFSLNGDLCTSCGLPAIKSISVSGAAPALTDGIYADGTNIVGSVDMSQACSVHGGLQRLNGYFKAPTPGLYTVTADDCDGGETKVPLTVAAISVSTDLAASSGVFDPITGKFTSATIALKTASSLGGGLQLQVIQGVQKPRPAQVGNPTREFSDEA